MVNIQIITLENLQNGFAFLVANLLVVCKNQHNKQWECKVERRFLANKYVCDGSIHCGDGSDEFKELCSTWNCTERYWKCRTNICISEDKVCDGLGNPDCIDGSDEAEEVCSIWNCTGGLWKCGSNKCIPIEGVCNGNFMWDMNICADGSDEAVELCSTWKCTEGYWKCGSNQCIPNERVCDKDHASWYPKCSDNTDEDPVLCSQWNCSAGYWKCNDGLQCVRGEVVCNSYRNCNDGSDEAPELCENRVCPHGSWRCLGRSYCSHSEFYCLIYSDNKTCPENFHICADEMHCLKDEFWCDGTMFEDFDMKGCPDQSDEGGRCDQWECLSDYWKCGDHLQCIEAKFVCDGQNHCNDGSDEGTNCKHWECLPDYWKCSDDLECIYANYVCDGRGIDDHFLFGCKDASDEHNKLCGCRFKPTENNIYNDYRMIDINDWLCLDGDGCIYDFSVCDGYDSCNDGSDELLTTCESWNCSVGMSKCSNMKCVNVTNTCGNGHQECNDKGSEQICWEWACADNWFECQDRIKCVHKSSLCDDKNDCYDKSDEDVDFCTQYVCLPGYEKCANKHQCIEETKICDGRYDCRDSSDELCNSHCLKTSLQKKSIIQKCQEDPGVCVPVNNYCDGVAHCPDASDEAQSGCTCEDLGLKSCRDGDKTYCLQLSWVGNKTSIGPLTRCLTTGNTPIGTDSKGLQSVIQISNSCISFCKQWCVVLPDNDVMMCRVEGRKSLEAILRQAGVIPLPL